MTEELYLRICRYVELLRSPDSEMILLGLNIVSNDSDLISMLKEDVHDDYFCSVAFRAYSSIANFLYSGTNIDKYIHASRIYQYLRDKLNKYDRGTIH